MIKFNIKLKPKDKPYDENVVFSSSGKEFIMRYNDNSDSVTIYTTKHPNIKLTTYLKISVEYFVKSGQWLIIREYKD
jgi:hypothetical protein